MNVYVITINTWFSRYNTTDIKGVYASLDAAKAALKDIEKVQKERLSDYDQCYLNAIKRSSKKGTKTESVRQTVTLRHSPGFMCDDNYIKIEIKEEPLHGFNK